jgi:hypothetical protein
MSYGIYDNQVGRTITEISWLTTRTWYYDDPNSDSLMEILFMAKTGHDTDYNHNIEEDVHNDFEGHYDDSLIVIANT